MSIIIKGLDMPKASNEDCMAVIRSNGKVEVWQTGMKEFEAEAIQIPMIHIRLVCCVRSSYNLSFYFSSSNIVGALSIMSIVS